MRMSRPVLQIGHRRGCSWEAESRLPGASALGWLRACDAPSKDRHSASFSFRLRYHRSVSIDRIPLPRYEKKLPVILSPAEVQRLLANSATLRM